ncbi:MAG: transposase, partial [Lawsonibacter sp.]|nr:transposase [Lawsonibacter sp.]
MELSCCRFCNCYRWFLGYPLQEETPHFSTVSYNFRHRFTEET